MEAFSEGYRAYSAGDWDAAEEIFSAGTDARYRIALAYVCMDRQDGKADPARAFGIFRELAEQGDRIACTDLGFCYAFGIGCQESPADAFAWYRRAAEAGFPRAMNNLAVCFLQGTGTSKDPAAAIAWLKKCDAQSDAMVLCNLGSAYAAAGDEAQAVCCYEKAAQRGDALAIRKLRERGMDVGGYTQQDADFGAELFAELMIP